MVKACNVLFAALAASVSALDGAAGAAPAVEGILTQSAHGSLMQADPLALGPMLLMSVEDCATLEDLRAWQQHRFGVIKKSVPTDFQHTAMDEMNRDFERRASELQAASQTFLAVEKETGMRPVFHRSWGTLSSQEELQAWRDSEEAKIREALPDESLQLGLDALNLEFERLAQDGRFEHDPPAFLFVKSAKGCNSMEELNQWRQHTAEQMKTSVPQELQASSLLAVDQEYEKHRERLAAAVQGSAATTLAALVGQPMAQPNAAAVGALAMALVGAAAVAILAVARRSAPEAEPGYILQVEA